MDAVQLLVVGQADEHRERQPVEPAGRRVSRHAVPVGARERRLVVPFVGGHERGVVDPIAGRKGVAGAARAEDAVGAEEAEQAVLAELRRLVAADEVRGIDRDADDAVETAVRTVDPPAELQRPFVGVPSPARLAGGE